MFFPPGFFRMIQIATSITWSAGAIVLALLFLLLVSIVSTTSADTFKRQAALFAWIALPSIPVLVGYELDLDVTSDVRTLAVALLLWTDVFAALAIGVCLRSLLSGSSNSPRVLSLPIAAFAVTVISVGIIKLIVEYGIFPELSDCLPTGIYLSKCGIFYYYDGFSASVILASALVVCGSALRASSNLIRSYEWLRGSMRRALASGYPDMATANAPREGAITRSPPASRAQPPEPYSNQAIKAALRTRREEFEL
jgi:hypothetical protein